MSDITQKVIEIIERQQPDLGGNVFTTSFFIQELQFDSLDAVELALALEGEFNIEIPDADLEGLRTVEDLIDYIQGKTP